MTIIVFSNWINLRGQELNIPWHDLMYLQVGDGVKLNRLQEPASLGLVLLNLTGTVNPGTGQTESYRFARHAYNLVETLSANASVALNLLIFKGDAGLSFFGRQTFNENDLTFIFVKTTDFGTTIYSAQDFSTNFWNQVALYQKEGLQDSALQSAITGTFGTHYVAGYRMGAMVSVIYTFHYVSGAARQQVSLSGSLDSIGNFADFSTFVSGFFGETNTSSTMSYQFYSSDPLQNPTNFGFASAERISSYSKFQTFVNQLENYANGMSRTRARITGYVLDPLKFVPSYLGLFSPSYTPPDTYPDPQYDAFLQAYSEVQLAERRLENWILDGDIRSWLNTQARQIILNQHLSAAGLIAEMKSIAINHFTKGAALSVPSDVAAFLGGLSDLRLPQILELANFPSGSDIYFIGRVDCGCRDMTIPRPFNTISELYYQTNNGTLAPLFYDPVEFERSQFRVFPSGTVSNQLYLLFTGGNWNCLTNPAISPDFCGYFLTSQPKTEVANWSLEITDASGNVVDELSFLSTQSGGCAIPCEVSSAVIPLVTPLARATGAARDTRPAPQPLAPVPGNAERRKSRPE